MTTFHFIVQRAASDSWSTQNPESFLIAAFNALQLPFRYSKKFPLIYNVKIEKKNNLTESNLSLIHVWTPTKLRTGFFNSETGVWIHNAKKHQQLHEAFVPVRFRPRRRVRLSRGKGRYNLYSFNVFVGLSDCSQNSLYRFCYYSIIPYKRPCILISVQATYQFFY